MWVWRLISKPFTSFRKFKTQLKAVLGLIKPDDEQKGKNDWIWWRKSGVFCCARRRNHLNRKRNAWVAGRCFLTIHPGSIFPITAGIARNGLTRCRNPFFVGESREIFGEDAGHVGNHSFFPAYYRIIRTIAWNAGNSICRRMGSKGTGVRSQAISGSLPHSDIRFRFPGRSFCWDLKEWNPYIIKKLLSV